MTATTSAGAGTGSAATPRTGPRGTPASRLEVTLDEPPTLGGLYARAARWAATAAVAGPAGRLLDRSGARDRGRAGSDKPPLALPEVAYHLAGVRAEADRLTAYQHLVGEPATDALPAGFVHVLGFPVATALMVRPDFPLPLLGMVHLANRVTQHRPLLLAERLDVCAWAQDLRPHRKGVQVDLVTEVRAEGDDAVAWRGVSTYLAPGARGAAGAPGRVAPPEPAAPPGSAGTPGSTAPPDREPPDGPRFVPPPPTALWRLDAGTGRRYAAVSGDVNPIHLSAASAKAFGFPRAIAHGMDTAARLLAGVGAARGAAFVWEVAFAKPVLLPSTPAARVARDDTGGFTLTLWDTRRGRAHVTGSVRPPG